MNEVWIALIGIVPACVTAILGYMKGYRSTDYQKTKSELTKKRIIFQRSSNPNFKELIYPNYGISLIAPVSLRADSINDGYADKLNGGPTEQINECASRSNLIGFSRHGRWHEYKKMEEATCADGFPQWHDATSTGYPLRRLLPSIAWLRFTGSLKFHSIFVTDNNDVVH